MEQEIKGHPLHPNCTLVLDSSGKRFVCNACKIAGSEMYIYSCAAAGCDFNLHGQCATCPEKFSFWGHPQHQLVLQRSSPDVGRGLLEVRPDIHALIMSTMPKGVLPVGCEMCTQLIEGMHYYCVTCGLLVHPVCAMLPKLVRSAAHEKHELALFCSAPTMCVACKLPAIWAYRCMPCLEFYHQNCLPENVGMFAKPFNGCPPHPIFVPPTTMSPVSDGARAIFNDANPFGVIHSYRHRGM